MALVIGTNCGFVTEAPTSDPDESQHNWDYKNNALKDVSPANAVKVIEIGWYLSFASENGNFEVGIYDHNVGDDNPENLLGKSAQTAHNTASGWKVVSGLNIEIDPNTTYWIAAQIDENVGVTASTDDASSPGDKYDWRSFRSTMDDPFGSSTGTSESLVAVYAVYETGATDYTENLSESFNLSDSLSKTSIFNIALSETLNLSDSLSSAADYNRLLDDIQTIKDSLSSKTEFKVLLNELQSITDSLSSEAQYNRSLDDSITMTDSLVDTLETLTRVLSKIYKLNLIKYDNILVSNNKVIKLGLTFDNKLKSKDKIIKLKTDKGGIIKI